MSFKIICTITILIGIFVFFAWKGIKKKKRMSILKEKIFTLAFFGIGFIMATLVWTMTLIISRNYVEVNAVVTNVEEVEKSYDDGIDFDYIVTFKYTYNNMEYYGNKNFQDKDKVPSGATKIKCNPDNPTKLANYELLWGSIIVSVGFGILDCFLVTDLINYMKNRNKKEDAYDSTI